jgi:hypothetical protein
VESNRVRTLLAIVAVLAVLRWVAVPWVQAQNEQHEQLDVLTQRLDRSIGVVQNKAKVLATLQAVRADVQQLRTRFPETASAAQFRLDTQRRFGDLATASGVQMKVFDWVQDGAIADAGLSYGRVRVTIEGPLKDMIRMHGAIEGELGHAAVRDIQMSLAAPAPAAAEARGTANLVIDLFYRSKA